MNWKGRISVRFSVGGERGEGKKVRRMAFSESEWYI